MSLKTFVKHNSLLYHAAKGLERASFPFLAGLCGLMRRLHGIDEKAVCLTCFNGALYNDNPRAVAEALHALRPDLKLLFCLNDRCMRSPDVPDYIIRVPARSLRALRAMATAKVIVRNQKMRPWMRKFPGQYYVQTWHGDRGFKKIRLDLHPADPSQILREGEWMDLSVAGSDFGAGVCRTGMACKGEVLNCGCPRNDLLIKNPPEAAGRVRKALGIPEGVRVLLYAPTFRSSGTGGKQNASVSLERVRETLEKATGEKWLCVTRSHEVNRGIRSDAELDASDWPETNELLLACDMMITDYSSIGGDFMLLNRPVVYYQPDIDDYRGSERGLYFDPDESPLLAVHTEAELLDLLSKPIDGPANCKEVLEFFGTRECGRAAEEVAKKIISYL